MKITYWLARHEDGCAGDHIRATTKRKCLERIAENDPDGYKALGNLKDSVEGGCRYCPPEKITGNYWGALDLIDMVMGGALE